MLNEQVTEISHQIDELTEKASSKKGSARGEVVVIVGTEAATTVDLKLTYSTCPLLAPSSLHFNGLFFFSLQLFQMFPGGQPTNSTPLLATANHPQRSLSNTAPALPNQLVRLGPTLPSPSALFRPTPLANPFQSFPSLRLNLR